MRRLTLSLLLVALFATVGLGWLFDQFYDQYYAGEQRQNRDKTQDVEQLGIALAKTLNALSNRQEFVQQWQKIQQRSGKAMQQYRLDIVAVRKSQLPENLLEDIRQGTPLLLETNNHLTYHFYLPKSSELLILNSVLRNNQRDEKSLNYIFTSLFYVILLSLFFLWALPLARQLLALRQAARSFGRGELRQRIKYSSFSYIRDIEIEFNHMARRIENLVGDVKLLSSAVSHDLRTPLARIRFGIDTLQEEDDPILRRRFEKKISDNVDEMTSLVETLLTYSRLDQTMLELNKESINMTQLIAACIEKVNYESSNVTFLHPHEDVVINADKKYITILINNLLQNGIKYGNGELLVQLVSQQDEVSLHLDDNGKGVATEMRDKIFLPFIRGTETSNRVGGHGVGLAIAKRVVEWHKGEINVCGSEKLSGARFIVALPRK